MWLFIKIPTIKVKERISIGKYANYYYLCIVLITFKGGGNTYNAAE
jgi:hypothetical protein